MAGTISSFPITTKGWSDFPLNTNPLDTDLIMGRSGASTSPMTLETSKQTHGGIIPWTSSFSFLAGNYTDRNALIYRAKQDHSNQDPETDATETYWEPISTAFKSGRKNAIINGNFDIWQRAVSQTSSGYGSDDRWSNDNFGSTKVHSRQSFALGQTDVPDNPRYYSRTIVTSSTGASNFVNKQQFIESVRTFAGRTITLSFWAKADSNKNIAAEFSQVFGTGGTPSASVTGISPTTFSLTTSWQKFSAVFTLPSISGKDLGTNDNDYLALSFWFDAGSDFDVRTNSLGQQSGTFDIAQVQIEKGTFATNFEYRGYNTEFDLCKKYGFLIHDGTGAFLIGTRVANTTSGTSTTGEMITSLNIPEMRVNPTIVGTPSNLQLLSETGGLLGTCTAHSWYRKNQNMMQLTFNSLDVSEVTQLRTLSYLFLDAEL